MRLLRNNMLLMLILALASGYATGGEKQFERKFQVSPGGTLSLETDAGSVSVTGASGNEVVVMARIEGRDRDVEAFTIDAKQNAGGVEVTGRAPKSFWRMLRGSDFDVEFIITVPKEYNLRLNTSGGNLHVADLKGKVEGGTSGGNIQLKQIEGMTTVETSGGDIQAEGLKGNLSAETSGGSVKVRNVTGSVIAETSGGNIVVEEVDGKVSAETSGGNVSVKVRGANKGVHAETSGGNVTIAIGRTVGGMIDASTSGGDVICDLPITVSGKISESRIKGTVNGGGELIYAHTSGGNVRIKPLD